MKIFALLGFAALVTLAQGCATAYDNCPDQDGGAYACECNSGELVSPTLSPSLRLESLGSFFILQLKCENIEHPSQQTFWQPIKNCPVPPGGGLQCVNGACTS